MVLDIGQEPAQHSRRNKDRREGKGLRCWLGDREDRIHCSHFSEFENQAKAILIHFLLVFESMIFKVTSHKLFKNDQNAFLSKLTQTWIKCAKTSFIPPTL